jgi:hypothetical protein
MAEYAGTSRWSVPACANSTPSFASSEDAVNVQHSAGRAALPRSLACTELPDLFTATSSVSSTRAALRRHIARSATQRCANEGCSGKALRQQHPVVLWPQFVVFGSPVIGA